MRRMAGAHASTGSGLGSMVSCCGIHLGGHDSPDVEFGQRGHSAFAAYRAETLQRLESEQRDFQQFLDRLRAANDKAEFDQFMAERKFRH